MAPGGDRYLRVEDALVGWRGDSRRITSNYFGEFKIPENPHTREAIATRPGYRIASASWLEMPQLRLQLKRLPHMDDPSYEWISPHPDPAKSENCANCHGEIYREWQGSAHARSATNPKFLSLYDGVTKRTAPNPANGNPLFEHEKWNARREHPAGEAVCASCHVPSYRSYLFENIRGASGVEKSGIHCDYCHKVADVSDGKFGLRFGRDALHLLRPAKGDPLTFGPLDDAVRPGESFAYAPIYKDSRYCASCHEGIVFGVHAYGTYSEWLESPAKRHGQQCQECHMAPTGQMTNIAPDKGGIRRNPQTLASHHTPGGQIDMLKKCLTLQVRAPSPGQIEIAVTAQNVGHRVPTGFPDRQVILVVEAFDATGNGAALLDGPKLPASVGKWKGVPGRLYAKQLSGEAGRSPVPFWLPILNTMDTRLVPDQPDRQVFRFPTNVQRLRVQLWYRRFWQEVADARGWTDNDVLIHETEEPRTN